MTRDWAQASLLVGKIKDQVDERFGLLVPLNEASAYMQTCPGAELAAGNSIMLGKSELMVTFSDGDTVSSPLGRAVELGEVPARQSFGAVSLRL